MPPSFDGLRTRLRPPCPVLDVHTHPLGEFTPNPPTRPADDARRLVEAARRSGVTRLCLFALSPGLPADPTMDQCRQANDYSLAMRDAGGGAILPFCYVNPGYPQESAAEIDRCVGRHRACGVKLWIARRASDRGLDPIMERAIAHGVPVLQHAWLKTTGQGPQESTPADVADLARRFPAARIIMAHLNGAGLRGIADLVDCPNVVVDTSGGDPEAAVVEAAVARLGRHRVVYGSDAPIRHWAVCIAKVTGTNLAVDVQRDILWNNAARLLPPWADVRPVEVQA